jgi:hypothetical protein
MQILGAFHARKPTSRKGRARRSSPSSSSAVSLPSRPSSSPPSLPSSHDDLVFVNMILEDNWRAWLEAMETLPAERIARIEAEARYYLSIQTYMDACECEEL